MKRLVPVLIACGAFALTGCKTDDGATSQPSSVSMGIVNDTCPVMGGRVNPDTETVQYDGDTVGFCCAGCIRGWESMSDDEKKASLAKYK